MMPQSQVADSCSERLKDGLHFALATEARRDDLDAHYPTHTAHRADELIE